MCCHWPSPSTRVHEARCCRSVQVVEARARLAVWGKVSTHSNNDLILGDRPRQVRLDPDSRAEIRAQSPCVARADSKVGLCSGLASTLLTGFRTALNPAQNSRHLGKLGRSAYRGLPAALEQLRKKRENITWKLLTPRGTTRARAPPAHTNRTWTASFLLFFVSPTVGIRHHPCPAASPLRPVGTRISPSRVSCRSTKWQLRKTCQSAVSGVDDLSQLT